MEISCIYCPNESFKKGKGSEEHAIISSLGGRKSSRNVCCKNCNNRLGKEIDEPCSNTFNFFSTMLGIRTGRNKPAPTQKRIAEHKGKEIDVHSGGAISYSKNSLEIKDNGSAAEISISASSEDEALKLLSGALNKYGKSIGDFESLEAKSVRSYVPGLHQRLDLGGDKQLRSVAKMALTYLATFVSPERLRTGGFRSIIQYINEDNVENRFVSVSSKPFPSTTQKKSEINHRLVVAASEQSKKVRAVLELFGNFRFFIALTNAWSGPSLSKVYTIDPVTQMSDEAESSHLEAIFDFSDGDKIKSVDLERLTARVLQSINERQYDEVISKIAENAVENHIVDKGEIITEEMISALASEAALEFTRVMHRIDTEETLDLVELYNSKKQRK